ncbi:ParA family protein [Flavobacterium sp. WW92]|uniref:ParA family protein n=1 Tax=unclassified Flavobacterium TaxID=196869 RepID=UPI002224C2D3|nr:MULTISPECIES: ParA family protein [unclassified Flavobacterium]WDO12314.1 ParA family protein [Flavobacterium sp. WW92]
MDTERKTQFVAFSTQKGGVGKSTFTTLVASLLHYRMGYNVAVFDCDFPQYSLVQLRERDLKQVMENQHLKRLAHQQFTTIGKKAYPVVQCMADSFQETADSYLAGYGEPLDVVLVDLPGTVNSFGVITLLAGVDHIFSPITADRFVLESTLSFTEVLHKILIKEGRGTLKSISLFWNQVDGREKSGLYDTYEGIISGMGLRLMNTFITDSKRFRKEGMAVGRSVFRSTLLPADEKLARECHLTEFMEEFLKITGL